MRFNKIAFAVAFVFSAILFAEVALHADEWDQSTKLTFSKPIEIPGQILPAGTYLFKLADLNDRHTVQVFDAKGTRLYGTFQTISTERRDSTDDVAVTLAEQPNGRPDALMKWFYPGDTSGHEFVYPRQEEQQLAQYRQQSIVAKETAAAGD